MIVRRRRPPAASASKNVNTYDPTHKPLDVTAIRPRPTWKCPGFRKRKLFGPPSAWRFLPCFKHGTVDSPLGQSSLMAEQEAAADIMLSFAL